MPSRRPYLAMAVIGLLGLAGLLRADLIGHWRLDGNANDSVGTNSGSLVGGAYTWLTSNNVAGSGALTLNPNDERSTYLNMGNPTSLQFGTNDFTLCLWVKKLVHSVNWAGTYGVSKWLSGANPGANEWTLSLVWASDDDQPVFAVEVGTTSYGITRPSDLSLGVWHQLLGVRRGTSLELYVDGTFAAQTTLPAGAAVNNVGKEFRIGASEQGPAFGASAIYDDLQVYNHAISNGGTAVGQVAGGDVAFLFANPGQTLASESFSLHRYVIAGGGGTSTNAPFTVRGTIAQHDAGGPLTNGPFSVIGGFWVLPQAVQTEGAPTLSILPGPPGLAVISWTPATATWVLQESTNLPLDWTNSVSGITNPVTVSASPPRKFYRLRKP